MKGAILSLLSLLLLLTSCGSKGDTFRLEGRMRNMNQGEFWVYSPDGGMVGIDTIKVRDSRFSYELELSDDATLMIVFPNYSEQPVFASPGATVSIKGDASHLKEMIIQGTTDNEDLTTLRLELNDLTPPDIPKAVSDFIEENPASRVSIYLLQRYFLQPPDLDYRQASKLTKLMVNGIDVTAGGKVNGDVVLEKAITRTKEIDLNYDQNSISMTFSALNFARPLQTFYRVRVRELSPNWREFSYFDSKGMVDSKGLLHLPLLALEAGTYHVEVQASVVKGKFVGTPYEWIVNVNQPWWRTTGIMAVFGLIVLALAVLNVIIFNRNTRLRMKRNNEEGDVIRRIKVFVERCENFSSDKLSPTQEEIYGTDKDSQVEVSNEFVEVMLKVIPFVQERNGRPFSMYMLSKVTDMELRDLYEMVLDNIYKSPRALIRSMRIDQVADQLLTTDKTIEDIATDCGFVSPNYMIAKFFHKYRMTPAEYREEYSE